MLNQHSVLLTRPLKTVISTSNIAILKVNHDIKPDDYRCKNLPPAMKVTLDIYPTLFEKESSRKFIYEICQIELWPELVCEKGDKRLVHVSRWKRWVAGRRWGWRLWTVWPSADERGLQSKAGDLGGTKHNAQWSHKLFKTDLCP